MDNYKAAWKALKVFLCIGDKFDSKVARKLLDTMSYLEIEYHIEIAEDIFKAVKEK